MSATHVKPGEVINLSKLPDDVPSDKSFALSKTEHMEIIRMTIAKDKQIPSHQVPGEITVFCLEGNVEFQVDEKKNNLSAGDWLYLSGGQSHSLQAFEDSSLLVTILL
jgi:quercetin dioxygenase-like cupin family protein